MSRVGRILLVTGGVLALTVHARAFKIDHHADITRQALSPAALQLPADVVRKLQSLGTVGGSPAQGFSTRAVNEIVDANVSTDTGDCTPGSDVPATPCQDNLLNSETVAALQYLEKEPDKDHFDNESILAASDQIVMERINLMDFARDGRYIGARKILGKILHGIQDFYAHSNYVELGFQDIDRRLGTDNGFRSGQPSLAGESEATCVDGATPNTTHLTSGYFFVNPIYGGLFDRLPTGFRDIAKISIDRKCRHGWSAGITQPGINKDTPPSDGDPVKQRRFAMAQRLAQAHSVDFITKVIQQLDSGTDQQKLDRVVGLLGYTTAEVIEGFKIGVPGAPGNQPWDQAAGLFATGDVKNIQPDVAVCMESSAVRQTCARICINADWVLDLNAYVCDGKAEPGKLGSIPVSPDLRVEVREADRFAYDASARIPGSQPPGYEYRPNRTIASFRVEDPRKCDPFCTLQLDQDRALWIEFTISPGSTFTAPRRTRQDKPLPPPGPIPVAKPSGSGSTSSTALTPAPSNSPPVPTNGTTPTGSAGFAAPTTPTAPGNPAAFARPTTTAAAPLRSADGIDQRLALRDLDNCTGADAFYPAPSATQLQTRQVYQMAAFSLAITDAAARQAVLNAIQARAGDDAFFSVMSDVIGNPLQSQALTTAYQNTARNIAQQIATAGLTSLMSSPVPPSALASYVDRWLASRLSTPALVSSAVDMMAKSTSVTAECTINELAKQGFTDMVLQR